MRVGQFVGRSMLALLGLTVLAFSLASTPAAAQTPQWTAVPAAGWTADATAQPAANIALKMDWQSKFNSDAVLYSPGDMGVDSWGNVYVSTQSSNVIKKFDKDGNFLMQWGANGKADGQFNLVLGVSVDKSDNVYVTDFYNYRIQKFDSNGKFLMAWANEKSTSPAFIGVDGKGNVYVDEFPAHETHYLQKFDRTGKLVSEWGGSDIKLDSRVEEIAVDADGNSYVAIPAAHHIVKLDTNGKLVATFGGDLSKDGKGLFDNPFSVAIDGKGNIYALDRNFLQKLDPNGKFIAQWPATGDLNQASNISVDSDGNIYAFAMTDIVTDTGAKKTVSLLKKFSQTESASW